MLPEIVFLGLIFVNFLPPMLLPTITTYIRKYTTFLKQIYMLITPSSILKFKDVCKKNRHKKPENLRLLVKLL